MRTLAAALAVLILALGACSGSTSRASETPPPSTAALERAVHEFQIAYLRGDGSTVWKFQTERCKRLTTRDRLIHHAKAYQALHEGLASTVDNIRIHRDPKNALTASVTYDVGGEPNFEPERWAVENGEWRYDFCGDAVPAPK